MQHPTPLFSFILFHHHIYSVFFGSFSFKSQSTAFSALSSFVHSLSPFILRLPLLFKKHPTPFFFFIFFHRDIYSLFLALFLSNSIKYLFNPFFLRPSFHILCPFPHFLPPLPFSFNITSTAFSILSSSSSFSFSSQHPTNSLFNPFLRPLPPSSPSPLPPPPPPEASNSSLR